MSTILKVDIVCDVATRSAPNVLTTELCDLRYNQHIDNTCCYSFCIYPTGWIRVCKIRFVSTGENRREPCLVCKNSCLVWIEKFVPRVTVQHHEACPVIQRVISRNGFFYHLYINWTASSEFGTYRLCEQRRFRRACASAQSRQNLRCSLIQAVSQEEPSDRKPDPWPL